jgi:uncharacterized protein
LRKRHRECRTGALRDRPIVAERRQRQPGTRLELILLFGVGPALLAASPRWAVTAGILAMGALCGAALLFDPTFPPNGFAGLAGARRGLTRVLLRAAVVGAALIAGAALLSPKPLLPRAHPAVWAIVMVLYPISAYAQEIACRTFFFHRYGHLFDRPSGRILASGLAFGWAHVAVNNVVAILLASAAGLVFAATYERWRSTILVSLEHALYGDVAFTAGLGGLFYANARWFHLFGR